MKKILLAALTVLVTFGSIVSANTKTTKKASCCNGGSCCYPASACCVGK